MVVDLAQNNGCTVFTAPDNTRGFIGLFPLGGSLFQTGWHADYSDAESMGDGSVAGNSSGAWSVYPGEFADCVIPADVVPGLNVLAAAGGYPPGYDAVDCVVMPGEIFQPPPAKVVTVKWQAIDAVDSLGAGQLVCLKPKLGDSPVVYGWAATCGKCGDAEVEVHVYSFDGKTKLNMNDFIVTKCC